MDFKKEILGVRCDILNENLDEHLILIGGNKIYVKKKHLSFLEPVHKFAVKGESPFYLKLSGIIDIAGPTRLRKYLIRVNSRGYCEKVFVGEDDVVF